MSSIPVLQYEKYRIACDWIEEEINSYCWHTKDWVPTTVIRNFGKWFAESDWTDVGPAWAEYKRTRPKN